MAEANGFQAAAICCGESRTTAYCTRCGRPLRPDVPELRPAGKKAAPAVAGEGDDAQPDGPQPRRNREQLANTEDCWGIDAPATSPQHPFTVDRAARDTYEFEFRVVGNLRSFERWRTWMESQFGLVIAEARMRPAVGTREIPT